MANLDLQVGSTKGTIQEWRGLGSWPKSGKAAQEDLPEALWVYIGPDDDDDDDGDSGAGDDNTSSAGFDDDRHRSCCYTVVLTSFTFVCSPELRGLDAA